MTVYLLRCKPTDHVYIGKTARNVRTRILEHRREAKQFRRTCPLYAAIRAHGWSSFEASVIVNSNSENWINRIERRLIRDCLKAGKCFNLDGGGLGGKVLFERTRAARRLPKPQREKIAESVRRSWREIRGAA